jgi:hypothetical protein
MTGDEMTGDEMTGYEMTREQNDRDEVLYFVLVPLPNMSDQAYIVNVLSYLSFVAPLSP